MAKTWKTPSGEYGDLYENMLAQSHLLVAGATGSGKSVIINNIIHAAMFKTPEEIQFILIDPKRVELVKYKALPHTIHYASEPETMPSALHYAMDLTEKRYRAMQKEGVRKYNGSDVYVIIDEYADLVTTNKKEVEPIIRRLCQIGRAARIHVIAATQCPTAQIINTTIKVNFDSRVALRTRSAQDSRNIIGVKGCETLPRYGYAVYMNPEEVELYKINMVEEEEIDRLVDFWKAQTKFSFFGRRKKSA